MKNINRWFFLSLCLWLIIPVFAEARAEMHVPLLQQEPAFHKEDMQNISEQDASISVSTDGRHSYKTKEGIEIISYVDTWPESRLREVAEELYRNRHGIEIEYLSRVEIYPGKEQSGNERVSASYDMELHEINIPVDLSGFLPADYRIKVPLEKGVIRIYRGEEKTEIEDLAIVLSHEYGHHFTFFHFDENFTSDKYKESTYYKVRRLYQYPEVNGEASYDERIHRWSIFEIAAEDYHQLLGSPTGKKTTRYLDISQKMGSPTYQRINTASREDFNAIPQENWNIPLASQVEGLYEYFISFLNEEPDATVMNMLSDPEDTDMPVLSYRVEEEFNFKRYIIEWNEAAAEDSEKPVYTLVAFDNENRLIPIKTVFPGEKTFAVVGTVTQIIDSYIYYYQDGLDRGSLDFRLYIQYPDGWVTASEDLTVNFN